jgi:hypothetical protein
MKPFGTIVPDPQPRRGTPRLLAAIALASCAAATAGYAWPHISLADLSAAQARQALTADRERDHRSSAIMVLQRDATATVQALLAIAATDDAVAPEARIALHNLRAALGER